MMVIQNLALKFKSQTLIDRVCNILIDGFMLGSYQLQIQIVYCIKDIGMKNP